MKWFRQGPSPHQTALAMVGARAGDRVLIRGSQNAPLAAEIGAVTGLNGRTLVTDARPGAREAVEAAAAAAGALVEFELGGVPDRGAWDISVLMIPLAALPDDERAASCRELVEALRPGGRLIVIDGVKRGRFARHSSGRLTEAEVLSLLERSGTRARRQLAAVDDVAYYEGRK